jgi:hypothetical protein
VRFQWAAGGDDFANGMIARRKQYGISDEAHRLRCDQRFSDAKCYEQVEFGLISEFDRRIAHG